MFLSLDKDNSLAALPVFVVLGVAGVVADESVAIVATVSFKLGSGLIGVDAIVVSPFSVVVWVVIVVVSMPSVRGIFETEIEIVFEELWWDSSGEAPKKSMLKLVVIERVGEQCYKC